MIYFEFGQVVQEEMSFALLICVDALHPSPEFFSHVRTFPWLK